MDAKQFFDLVVQTRAAQRQYAKTGDNTALRYSRDLERKVDAEIKRVEMITKEKQSPRLDL